MGAFENRFHCHLASYCTAYSCMFSWLITLNRSLWVLILQLKQTNNSLGWGLKRNACEIICDTLLPAVVGFMQVSETYSRQVFKAAEA